MTFSDHRYMYRFHQTLLLPEDDETIIEQTVDRLRATGLDVDAVNAGVPGYSTEQTRMLLEEDGWQLEPTLLLIGNLWSSSSVWRSSSSSGHWTARPAISAAAVTDGHGHGLVGHVPGPTGPGEKYEIYEM